MCDVYAAQSNAKKHIVEQCANCNVKKNSNGLYNHDDIVKAKEMIEGVLKEVFLDFFAESEVPMTCKYCIKYAKKQHPKHITPDTCMYNKKVRKFRYNSMCKKMNLKYIDYQDFKTGEEDHSGQSIRNGRGRKKIIDGVGDMITTMNEMKMDGSRWLETNVVKQQHQHYKQTSTILYHQ
jgi:hypothetical protein